MRCLEALGQWDELTEKSTDFMTTDSNNLNQNGMVILTDDKAKTRFREAAKLATMAAWHRENWENFEQNMKHIPTGKFLKSRVRQKLVVISRLMKNQINCPCNRNKIGSLFRDK